jgi:hypothetical protein
MTNNERAYSPAPMRMGFFDAHDRLCHANASFLDSFEIALGDEPQAWGEIMRACYRLTVDRFRFT